jgi:hypothetical protein
MHPVISHELATTQSADLRYPARREALTRAAASGPPSTPQPGRNRILASLRRVGRQRRFGTQLWTLLHAPALLDGKEPRPAAADAGTGWRLRHP